MGQHGMFLKLQQILIGQQHMWTEGQDKEERPGTFWVVPEPPNLAFFICG